MIEDGNISRNDGSNGRTRIGSSSEFDVSLMPQDRIVKRTLYPWSVHHSGETNTWIATISRPDPLVNYSLRPSDGQLPSSQPKLKYLQFSLPVEKEAKKLCRSYAPPKLEVLSCTSRCQHCTASLSVPAGSTRVKNHNCVNCGVLLCDKKTCMATWAPKMVPKTYLGAAYSCTFIRVCPSCDWLSNAFCLALLQGRYEDAMALHRSGNVNLRTAFAAIHGEAM
jgi:hypothetical protein